MAMSIKSLDEQPGLLRQRRNLILMSVLIVFYSMSESNITGISMNGLGLKVGNPYAFNILFMVTLFYFFIRYNSYLVSSNGKGTKAFRDIIRGKISKKPILDYSRSMKLKIEKSINEHGLKYWRESENEFDNNNMPEKLNYNITGGRKSESWTGHVSFPPNLEYKLGIPIWQMWHYNKENELVYVQENFKVAHYIDVIKAEYKAITEEPYYLDFRFPYWLFWMANLSFLITYAMEVLKK
jgi:hypothetical protein